MLEIEYWNGKRSHPPPPLLHHHKPRQANSQAQSAPLSPWDQRRRQWVEKKDHCLHRLEEAWLTWNVHWRKFAKSVTSFKAIYFTSKNWETREWQLPFPRLAGFVYNSTWTSRAVLSGSPNNLMSATIHAKMLSHQKSQSFSHSGCARAVPKQKDKCNENSSLNRLEIEFGFANVRLLLRGPFCHIRHDHRRQHHHRRHQHHHGPDQITTLMHNTHPIPDRWKHDPKGSFRVSKSCQRQTDFVRKYVRLCILQCTFGLVVPKVSTGTLLWNPISVTMFMWQADHDSLINWLILY